MMVEFSGRRRLEILGWFLAALLCFVLSAYWHPMPLADDGYQYLTVAANLNNGRGLVTDLVHFDSERSNGRVPAPLTTFPPGYPIAVAAMSRFGLNAVTAARLVSGLGYAGTAALLSATMILMRTAPLIRQLILLLFVFNAINLRFASAVLTEELFTLIAMAAIASLIFVEAGISRRGVLIFLMLAGYALVGLSYAVRYAGIFLIIAVCVYTFLNVLVDRNRFRLYSLVACVFPIAVAGVIMWRNISIVGNWRGGNEMQVRHAVSSVAAEYVRAHVHLIFGEHAVLFGLWELLLVAGLLAILVLSRTAVFRTTWPRPARPVVLVMLCIGVYSAGIVYAGLRTPISFGTRMFLPILPLYLLILALALSWVIRQPRLRSQGTLLKYALVLSVAGYVGSNARDLYMRDEPPQYQVLAKEYRLPVAGGEPLLNWVRSHVTSSDRIFAEDGQATGYLLKVPTVSLVGPRYSRVRWDCDTMRGEMSRFGARYLFLYKTPATLDDSEILESSRFLAQAASQPPGCGFRVAAENARVRILEIAAPRD